MEEDVLDRLPYLLRRHTLKGEMEELKEEREMLVGKEVILSKIFAFIPNNHLGEKTLDTSISIARRFGCELHLAYDAEPSKERTEKIAKSGVVVKRLELRRSNLENELLSLAGRKKFDILILPSSFGKRTLKKISITTDNIVEKAKRAVLVIK